MAASDFREAFQYYLRAAYHEAGHAVVAHALGFRVRSIDLGGDGMAVRAGTYRAEGGFTVVRTPRGYLPRDFNGPGREIAWTFGGYLAERRAYVSERWRALQGALEDFESVDDRYPFGDYGEAVWRARLASPEGWRRYVRFWMRLAGRVVRENWAIVERIADRASDGIDEELAQRLLRGTKRVRLGRKQLGLPGAATVSPRILVSG